MTFDAETHTYTLNGVEYPSVTTIMRDAGIIDTRFYKPSGTMRGTIVHELTAGVDADEIDVDELSDHEHWGYIEAWEMFKLDQGFEPDLVEHLVYSIPLFYAGTIDVVGTMDGDYWLLDKKTGRPEKWHTLQSAAYAIALAERIEGVQLEKIRRGGVYLKANGKYQFKEHDDPEDLLVWKYGRKFALCNR